jgi:hypothetical protein
MKGIVRVPGTMLDMVPAASLEQRLFDLNKDPDHAALYFVRSGQFGPIKIGVATHVVKRLATLQTGNPEPLMFMTSVCVPASRSYVEERRVHEVFCGLRIRGEWFRPERSLIEMIEAISFGDDLNSALAYSARELRGLEN